MLVNDCQYYAFSVAITLNGGGLGRLACAEWRRLRETKAVVDGTSSTSKNRGTSGSWSSSSYGAKVVACNAGSKLRDGATKSKHDS